MTDLEEIRIRLAGLEEYNRHNDEYHLEESIKNKNMSEKIDDIHQLLTAGGLIGKLILWIAGLITAVGGAYLMIRQIFFHN